MVDHGFAFAFELAKLRRRSVVVATCPFAHVGPSVSIAVLCVAVAKGPEETHLGRKYSAAYRTSEFVV